MENISNKKEESDWKFNLGAFIVIVLTVIGGYMVLMWVFNWIFIEDDSEEPQKIEEIEESHERIVRDYNKKISVLECEIKGGKIGVSKTPEDITIPEGEMVFYVPETVCQKNGIDYTRWNSQWVYKENKILK